MKIAELLGMDATAATAPAHFVALFSKDNQCVGHVPAGTIYPSKDEILAVFTRTYEAAFKALRECDDALLLGHQSSRLAAEEYLPHARCRC